MSCASKTGHLHLLLTAIFRKLAHCILFQISIEVVSKKKRPESRLQVMKNRPDLLTGYKIQISDAVSDLKHSR